MLQSPFVLPQRFELRTDDSKSPVLPLHHKSREPCAGIEPASSAYKADASPKMLKRLNAVQSGYDPLPPVFQTGASTKLASAPL